MVSCAITMLLIFLQCGSTAFRLPHRNALSSSSSTLLTSRLRSTISDCDPPSDTEHGDDNDGSNMVKPYAERSWMVTNPHSFVHDIEAPLTSLLLHTLQVTVEPLAGTAAECSNPVTPVPTAGPARRSCPVALRQGPHVYTSPISPRSHPLLAHTTALAHYHTTTLQVTHCINQ